MRCTSYEKLEDLENSKSIKNGVYIVCQWNNALDLTANAHYYMVVNTGSGLVAYNNYPSSGATFADLINVGTLILAYRIYE